MNRSSNETQKGLFFILLVYIIWGVLPAYWKLLQQVEPVLIIAHRVVWAFIFQIILIAILFKPRDVLEPLKNKKNIVLFILASLTLLGQWFFYILTIVTSHIVELSLGYYIYPIIAVVFSTLFFHEKMSIYTKIAFTLALAGVFILIIRYKTVPILGLGVAVSFAFYSLIKKKLRVNALISTFFEMLFLLPFALGYIIYWKVTGGGYLVMSSSDIYTPLLLIGGGIATCATLLLFGAGTKRISFSAVGFLQYISPTMALFLAIAVYKEAFGLGDWVSFGGIWVAIIIYSIPAARDVFSKKRDMRRRNKYQV